MSAFIALSPFILLLLLLLPGGIWRHDTAYQFQEASQRQGKATKAL